MKKCKQCKKELNSYYEDEFCSKECQRTFNHKNRKCKILIPTSCRSDDPLTRPMIDHLEKDDFFDIYTYNLVPGIFGNNYQFVEDLIKNQFKPECKRDCILIMGDRIEMFAAAVAAFHNNIPIIVYGSGITNTISTFDDINRHSISLMADVCLCETFTSAMNVAYLWEIIKKIKDSAYYTENMLKDRNIHIVGNLYLESLSKIDESLVPSEPYDLVLYNPTTLYEEMVDIFRTRFGKDTIWIGPNPDPQGWFDLSKPITHLWEEDRSNIMLKYYENVPRPQFLGLLKNATRFITNSSSAYYEAMPLGLTREQILLVGERNKNRSTPMEWNQDYKTSERIVEIIKKWWLEKNENDKR